MNFKSPGGEGITGVSTVADCQMACGSRAECVGFDYVAPTGCWLRVNLANGVIEAPPAEGVTHYRYIWNCDGEPLLFAVCLCISQNICLNLE